MDSSSPLPIGLIRLYQREGMIAPSDPPLAAYVEVVDHSNHRDESRPGSTGLCLYTGDWLSYPGRRVVGLTNPDLF